MQGSIREKNQGCARSIVIALLGLQVMAATSQAQPIYSMTNGNSTIDINVGGGSGLAGMANWLVDGVNQAK